jgi:putative hydrolase of the HAD superfamily
MAASQVVATYDQTKRRIQAIIFDLDDTLISWERPTTSREEFYFPRIEKIHATLSQAGHSLPPCAEFWQAIDRAISAMWAEARETWRITPLGRLLEQQLGELGLDTARLDADQLLELLDWAPRPGVELFPETRPVLLALREKGYKTGLLTNSFVPMWMRDLELQAYGLLDLLDVRVSAADVGYLKPHPAIYHHLLARMDSPPERAVFVGDRPANDIAGANAVGLTSVLVKPAYLARELEDIRPDYHIERLDELLPLLEQI